MRRVARIACLSGPRLALLGKAAGATFRLPVNENDFRPHCAVLSRGAVIAATVARDLDVGLVINGQLYQGISVQFVGLFDPVSRMGARVKTKNGWKGSFSGNIVSHANLIHTAVNDWEDGELLKPILTFWPYTPFGQATTHQDVGHDPNALKWMITQAQAAGVRVQ